jgi:hypothetical protein
MRALIAALIAAALASSGCERGHGSAGAAPPSLSPATRAAVTDAVRQFAQDVAHDVTREGPAAWRRYFSPSPSFFMASDGQLVFSSAASAARGIDDLTRTIKSIELRWGDDLRVDPLTPDLAVLASSWAEIIIARDAGRVTARGFFTGVAERRDGRWKFRNAHWSVAAPAPKAS